MISSRPAAAASLPPIGHDRRSCGQSTAWLSKRRGDRRARTRLIEAHLPLARRLARRYARDRAQLEDLTQVANLGLVKAVDRFDPQRGTPFMSFAVPTIVGELKRHFRDTGWAMRVPRELQERALRVQRISDGLAAADGRSPRIRDVAHAAGLTEEEVIEAREAALVHHAESLDAVAGASDDGTFSWSDCVGRDDEGYELVDDLSTIAPLFGELPERQRAILRLRFVDDLTQAEIGRRLNVSQMHVSRMLRAGLESLREGAEASRSTQPSARRGRGVSAGRQHSHSASFRPRASGHAEANA